jgi:hypothetical protein
MAIKIRSTSTSPSVCWPADRLRWPRLVQCSKRGTARHIRGLLWLCAGLSTLFPVMVSAAAPSGRLDATNTEVKAVIAVQGEVTADWMQQSEVLGTAVALDSNGKPALTVYVDRYAPRASEVVISLPSSIRGVPVQVHLTDKFRANQGAGTLTGVNHSVLQNPPIQLGTSGGWSKDVGDTGGCCGGTIGALVSIDGVQYVLSNYHVFEGNTVNGVSAQTGDTIIQPGLMDANCLKRDSQAAATLVKNGSSLNNNVDCSIAQVLPGMVRTDGSILEIGTISSTTIAAALNQLVEKSGRTTGLTHSTVSGLNATIAVNYGNTCGGSTAFIKTFTGQIVLENGDNVFFDHGDSGSLMVEDTMSHPHPIGLLFASSGTAAVANPIEEVLSFLGATMVGEQASASQPLNVSTRLRVQTGEQVLIAGFIISGSDPKKVILRGIGPSLNGTGVTLSDPTLELHQGDTILATNDNWKVNDQTGQSQETDIRATTIPPPNDLESAIVATLSPGNYTAILAGKSGGTGVGLVEVYDLAQAANSKLANISSRGFVDINDNAMIGGFIVGGGSGGGTAKVIVRAIGPSLSVNGTPVPGRLADPTLELHDGSGTTIATNDNWKIDDQTGQSQEADIRATTIPPTDDLESALVATLAPGNYTAIVRGKNNTTGVGLVEVYNLQ